MGAPLPLLVGFALFIGALVWLLVSSLQRRDAPVFALSAADRVRPAHWEETGDTLTLDATDEEHWRFASLVSGRALPPDDSTGWTIAVQRHRITVAGALADLGIVPFESAALTDSATFLPSTADRANDAIKRWYAYSFTTHLLTSTRHVYALRTRDGAMWKIEVLGYYCPGLTAGCLTIRYAPLRQPHA